MKIIKFGGTSVGQPQRMHQVARLVSAGTEAKIVVLSALSGTTNVLVEISLLLANKQGEAAEKAIDGLNSHYQQFISGLLHDAEAVSEANSMAASHFSFMKSLLKKEYTENLGKELLSQGELLSTKLFYAYLREQKIACVLISALDFMFIDEDKEPVLDKIKQGLHEIIARNKGQQIFITQGFICLNHQGEVDNLKRGGSDYTASLVGAAIQAEEVQIWTDIDGMHNNDPRIVKNTFPIAELSFDEAAELAYFGAKILHPSSIWPAQKYNVPVRLKNTMKPEAPGTLITAEEKNKGIKAIAAKDGITTIKIKSSRMLLAYGFLRKIFEIFEKYKTPIDMITTSEVAVSVTIDDTTHLAQIQKELSALGMVEIGHDHAIICIVGEFVAEKSGIIKKVLNSLGDIPIRMISYGGSRHNISVLVKAAYKNEALQQLNRGLFE